MPEGGGDVHGTRLRRRPVGRGPLQDRSPFLLSSLLKASVAFHRDLLGGAPLASPFRHYTRLTVSARGAAFAVALNGSALLRTCDLVALRPLNQDAFDEACESSEVRSGYGFVLGFIIYSLISGFLETIGF